MLLGQSGKRLTNSSRKKEVAGSKRKHPHIQLWMCLVVKVKTEAVKNNIAEEPGTLGP